jgi:esterase/lipase superfamily enzyme
MELLVFGHAGARVLVFPTRAGRFYDYENWGLVEAVRWQVEQGLLQLICVDSVDSESLYAFWRPPHERIARHVEYESYILDEVLPLTEAINPTPFLIAHGCSLGAYHATNIALRHPQRFQKLVAFSGRYDLTTPAGGFRSLFDDYYDETIYFHTPCHFVPQLHDPCVLDAMRRMQITLVVGADDPFVESNQRLSTALWDKGVWHALYLWPNEAHRVRHWREMAPLYL